MLLKDADKAPQSTYTAPQASLRWTEGYAPPRRMFLPHSFLRDYTGDIVSCSFVLDQQDGTDPVTGVSADACDNSEPFTFHSL